MHRLGITAGAALRNCTLQFLTRNFGKMGAVYFNFARGIDNRPVEPEWIRKSVGCEHTYDEDIRELDDALEAINELIPRLMSRIERAGFQGGRCITLKVKFHDFTIKNRSLTAPTDPTDHETIRFYLNKLMCAVDWEGKHIRLLGISVAVPYKKSESGQQLEIEFPDFII